MTFVGPLTSVILGCNCKLIEVKIVVVRNLGIRGGVGSWGGDFLNTYV